MIDVFCNGICLTASDVGVPGQGIAYAHPCCPVHGDYPDHQFGLASVDGHGHEICICGAVRASHYGEEPCLHLQVRNGHCFDCGWKP